MAYTSTIRKKLVILKDLARFGYMKTSKKYNLCFTTLLNYKRKAKKYLEVIHKNVRRNLYPKRKGSFPMIEEALIEYAESLITSNKAFNSKHLALWLIKNNPSFKEKKFKSISHYVYDVMKRSGYSWRRVTNKSNNKLSPEEIDYISSNFKAEIKDFLKLKKIRINSVFNMDQTPAYFNVLSRNCYVRKGSKRVTISFTNQDKQRYSVFLTITKSGEKLPCLVVFKAQYNKTVHKKMLKNSLVIQKKIHVSCQPNAWADKNTLNDYFKLIFLPSLTGNSNSLLIVDQLNSKPSDHVFKLLKKKKCFVKFVPKGMTM